MSLVDTGNRKKLELEQKINSLEREFASWYEKSENNTGKFAKHHTQIRAIKAMLEPLHAGIRNKLNAYQPQQTEDFLKSCANSEKLILSEHRIWNYFRNKFIQRNEDLFNVYLDAADEFAWECYRPIQEAVYPDPLSAQRKEPPLVFLNGGASPFSVSRDRSFEPEAVVGGGISLDPETVGKLPIPVIGVPWYQVNHLPEILVIGHEVGHIVEKDFGLTMQLEQHLNEALEKANASTRKEAWKSWLGEIFADLYGCLAGGAAFAGTLTDFVINDNQSIYREVKKSPDWGKYPTAYLRVHLVLCALDCLNAGEQIKGYKTIWEGFESSMSEDFINDIKIIVPHLLEAKYDKLGGRALADIFRFSNQMQSDAEDAVLSFNYIKDEAVVAPINSVDIRVLFAALRMAFEQRPDVYVKNQYGQAVLSHIKTNILKPSVRSGEILLTETEIAKKNADYRQAGLELLNIKSDQ